MSTFSSSKSATRVVSLGRPPRVDGAAVNPPIAMSSTFVGSGYVTAENRVYARFSNAAWEPLEDAIGQLEGSPTAGLAYASGLAAVSAVFDLVPGGGVLVIPTASYNGTIALARALSADGKLQLREVDPIDTEATIAAMDGADLFWIESPSNPLLEIAELPTLIAAAHDRGLLVAVDNTFSTPLRQQPLRVGADVVVHSATKFMGGHGSVMGGVIVDGGKFDWTQNDKFPGITKPNPSYHGVVFSEACGNIAYVMKIRTTLMRDQGATISPFNSFLLLQGLETLSLRVERHVENALKVVEFLKNHPQVEKVNHPSLAEGHQLDLYNKYFPNGAASIFTFEVKGGQEKAQKFTESLELFSLLANVADVKSLVIHPASTTHSQMNEEELREGGITPSTVRLSIGTENIDDIIADLEHGFEAIK